MSTTLDTEIRDALEARRGDWPAIAKQSNVSYSWISKFVNGHIENPGYETLKQLHAYLFATQPATQQVQAEQVA